MFSVSQYVSLQVGGLCEALAAKVKGTMVGSIPCVYPHVSAQIKIQGKSFATSFKRALKLNVVSQLVNCDG